MEGLFGLALVILIPFVIFQFIPSKTKFMNFEDEADYGKKIQKENNWVNYSIIVFIIFFICLAVFVAGL